MFKLNQSQTNQQPDQVDPSKQLVDNAPSLSEGDSAIANYIENNVVQKELTDLQDKSDYAPEKAAVIGRKQGLSDDNSLDFPSKCHNAYREIMHHARIVLTGIVKREKNVISNAIKAHMPDMKRLLEQELSRNEVEKLTAAAEKRRKAEQKADLFLIDRGFDIDSPEAREGAGYGDWKFWMPLLVMLIFEVLVNYLLLDNATPRLKILTAVSSVVVVLGFGWLFSWLLKMNSGVRKKDDLRTSKKLSYSVGMVFCCTVFTISLAFFIFYRAALPVTVNNSFFTQLATAFTNNITDFGLAFCNVIFFIIAVVTFRNATSRISGYDELAKERGKRIRGYKQIRGRLHNQAKAVFDETNASIARRQKVSDQIEMNWHMIKDTCEQIPNIESDAIKIIDQQYTATIEKYREGFEKGRYPTDEIKEDVREKIPSIVRIGMPIIPLAKDTKSMQKLPAFEELSSMNFEEEIKLFADNVTQWQQENSDFEKLNEFGRDLISKHRKRILQEMQDDGITISDNKQAMVVDE